jgi:polar amino acid transport system permease protein
MDVFHYLGIVVNGIGVTFLVTFGAFGIGLIGAIPVAILRDSPFRAVRSVAISYVELLRGVPQLTWLFVAFFGLPELGIRMSAVQTSIVVLGIVATAYIAEIYRAALRGVNSGQLEASQALGLGTFQTYFRVVGPQAARTVLPLSISYLIGLFKESALASTLGALDITGMASIAARTDLRGLEAFSAAAILYLVISVPIGLGARLLGKRLGAPTAATTTRARQLV